MDFNQFWLDIWEAFTCTQGVSCFERYRPSVEGRARRPVAVTQHHSKPKDFVESDWSEDEAPVIPLSVVERQKLTPLQRHRRKLNTRVKLLGLEGSKEPEERVSLRISEDGKTLTWSDEKTPRTYHGSVSGVPVDDISEVQIESTNDRIVLISAFDGSDESYGDETGPENYKTFTTRFKFRKSENLTEWVADLDTFLNDFSPAEEKKILDFEDATGRMSTVLSSGTMVKTDQ